MTNLTELDKLEWYLKSRGIKYERIDQPTKVDQYGMIIQWERHQICVPAKGELCEWDAICHIGSYGYQLGLLEIMGSLVNEIKDGDSVVGWLTAEDVIKRVEKDETAKNSIRKAL